MKVGVICPNFYRQCSVLMSWAPKGVQSSALAATGVVGEAFSNLISSLSENYQNFHAFEDWACVNIAQLFIYLFIYLLMECIAGNRLTESDQVSFFFLYYLS